ncbi:HNH endonuclease signature motif containing protein [Corynebacterium endometrii]|uniref:HNH nuclease domain-containing protein n=1 Tax=Corynebacterium endometrii TaxID=2488819 RepID=A0A4P7QFU9_9CORY|nr:HNH endonuclease signature motif containing protein [Corynebacterium endometrii]QCB27634.1 hypothetical protein CENDO_01660 [Corynebacterium endometrii]
MDTLEGLFRQLSRGIELISLVEGASPADLAALGASGEDAKDYAHLWQVYFGPTGSTRKQAAARDAAITRGLSLADLRTIERFVRRIKDHNKAWDLRVELASIAPGEIVRTGRRRVKELVPPKRKQPGTRLRRSADGMWDIRITGPSETIADIYSGLDGTLEAFTRAYFTGTGHNTVVTNVVVQLDELDKIIAGEGDEVILQLTNGATMTGAQFLQRRLAGYAYFGLFHPLEGPVNAYRTQRLANFKQHVLAAMENPVCAWPGCLRGADECQAHHIDAYGDGGDTNSPNLAKLCGYHNGVNEDGVDIPTRRGKIIRRRGATCWLAPHARACIPTGMYVV